MLSMNNDAVDDCLNDLSLGTFSVEPLLLSDHVRIAVKEYVARLGGEDIGNLYNIVLNEVERPLIQTVLELCGQNQSKAALMLGLSRSTLRKKISNFNKL